MIQKNDLILLLTELSDNGDTKADEMIYKLLTSSSIDLDILKYINSKKTLDTINFYEGIRKSYNNKRSSLYKNIVKDTENIDDILAALHSFTLQAFLYSKKLEEEKRILFFKHIRMEEITRVLNNYYKDFNASDVFKVIKLLKVDLIAFETINGRRD